MRRNGCSRIEVITWEDMAAQFGHVGVLTYEFNKEKPR